MNYACPLSLLIPSRRVSYIRIIIQGNSRSVSHIGAREAADGHKSRPPVAKKKNEGILTLDLLRRATIRVLQIDAKPPPHRAPAPADATNGADDARVRCTRANNHAANNHVVLDEARVPIVLDVIDCVIFVQSRGTLDSCTNSECRIVVL